MPYIASKTAEDLSGDEIHRRLQRHIIQELTSIPAAQAQAAAIT
jgi:hypothetical protein